MDHVVRYISSKVITAHAIAIASDSEGALAPSAAEPCEYPRNATSAPQMPVNPPQATGSYNSLTEETKSLKLAEVRKEGEQTKDFQCKGQHPPFQESGQENRAVDQNVHANAMQGGDRKKKMHDYEDQLRMKQTVSLSFDPTHSVSGEGGAQVISLIDDASWEVIDYTGGPA